MKIYVVNWFGPFSSIEDVEKWEKKNNENCNFYLIDGYFPRSKVLRYYCGQTKREGVHCRLKDKSHPINDFKKISEIWIGFLVNSDGEKDEINIVEKMATSVLAKKIGDKYMVNKTNKSFPKTDVCLINEWKKKDKSSWKQCKFEESVMKIIPDVMLHKYVYEKDYEMKHHIIKGSEKMKILIDDWVEDF